MEVLDSVKAQWPGADCIEIFTTNDKSFAEIENMVLLEASKLKVVVLYNAHLLSDRLKPRITKWAWDIIVGHLTRTILIVATDEDDPVTSEDWYRPFVEKGRFVECKKMSVDGMKRYAIEDYGCTEEAADLLLELVSYNFTRLNNELEKLSCLDRKPIDVPIVREFVVFSADDLFVNYMLNHNSAKALQVVSAVPNTTIKYVLSTLAKKLSFLYLVIINDTQGVTAHKLAAGLGVQPWQLLEYFAYKKYWNSGLVLDRLRLLTEIEKHYSVGGGSELPLLASWW